MDQDSRREWSNKCEFLISALGFAVGLGNIWRFPYVAYKNGGGSFMVPYMSMLILVGLPIFFLEFVLGQYSGCGPTRLFGKIAPMFKGLGFAMISLCFFIAIYYNVIIGKKHALKKYDQFTLNTSCFCSKYHICAISRNFCYKNNE